MECLSCYKNSCDFVPNCMDLISTDMVEDAVLRQLALKRPSRRGLKIVRISWRAGLLPAAVASADSQPEQAILPEQGRRRLHQSWEKAAVQIGAPL